MLTSTLFFPPKIAPRKTNTAAATRIRKITRIATIPTLDPPPLSAMLILSFEWAHELKKENSTAQCCLVVQASFRRRQTGCHVEMSEITGLRSCRELLLVAEHGRSPLVSVQKADSHFRSCVPKSPRQSANRRSSVIFFSWQRGGGAFQRLARREHVFAPCELEDRLYW